MPPAKDLYGLNTYQRSAQIQVSDLFKPWEDRRELFRSLNVPVRLAPDRILFAHFAVFASTPREPIPELAPLAVVTVISPEDRHQAVMAQSNEYEEAGVDFIFVALPRTHKLHRYVHGDLHSVTALDLPEHNISIPLNAIFG